MINVAILSVIRRWQGLQQEKVRDQERSLWVHSNFRSATTGHGPSRLSFIGNIVGLACPLDVRKSYFTKMHPSDKKVVRTDDIQEL